MPSAVSAALAALALTRPGYTEAAQFYDGEVAEIVAAPKLAELLGDTGSAYCVNYARTPVDVLVERTMIQGWTCKDAGQLAQITQAWDDNELGLEAKDVHRRAYEYGDSYLIGWADDEAPSGVSVFAHEPSSVRVFYRADQPRKKSHAVHTWDEAGDRSDTGNGLGEDGIWRRVNLYYADHVERYVSRTPVATIINGVINYVGTGATDDWVDYDADGEDSLILYVNEGLPDVVPVFHFRTGRPYGRPEHADAYGPQRGINKLVTSMMGSVDFHILPQRYATTESALRGDPLPDLFGDSSGVDPETGLGDGSSMESGPGSVWLLSGQGINVGEFSAALMSNFLEPKNDLVDSMAAVTDLPIDRFRPASGQAPSGESQRMAEIPLNKKTSDRFAQFGVTWHEWASWVLAVQASGSELVETDAQVAWAPPETYSDEASWKTAALQIAAGVPYAQVLRERGYSAEVVAEWSKARDAALAAAAPVTDVTDTEDTDVNVA